MATRTLDSLRRGARIHSLFYASHIARNADRLYDVAWQGLGYRRTSKEGAHGIVLFGRLGAVGAFFDPAAEARLGKAKKKGGAQALVDLVKGMPPALAAVTKREVFPAMSLDSDRPSITSLFWADAKDGALAAARPWARIDEDGAHLVSAEVLAPDACVDALAARYAFDPSRVDAIRATFASDCALAEPANGKIVLPPDVRQALGVLPNQATRELLAGAAIELG